MLNDHFYVKNCAILQVSSVSTFMILILSVWIIALKIVGTNEKKIDPISPSNISIIFFAFKRFKYNYNRLNGAYKNIKK